MLLTHLPDLARLEVSDNGIGFDPLRRAAWFPAAAWGWWGCRSA